MLNKRPLTMLNKRRVWERSDRDGVDWRLVTISERNGTHYRARFWVPNRRTLCLE